MATRAVGRDDDLGAKGFERFAEVIGVVGLVCQQALRRRDVIEQPDGEADVGNIAWCHDEGDRLALSVGQSVDLAGPPAT